MMLAYSLLSGRGIEIGEALTQTDGGDPARPAPRRTGRPGHRSRRAAVLLFGLSVSVVLTACGASAGTRPQAGGSAGVRPQSTGSGAPSQSASAAANPAGPGPGGRWALTWSADFNKPGALSKWLYYSGGDGFNLKQLQWYDAANATINNDGQLVLTATDEGNGEKCWYGPCQYTSARMETKNTFAQTYGEFEARIKFPVGQGLWPAFWIEGADVYQVGWPASGEVDIVEPSGHNPYLVQSFAHAPNKTKNNTLTVTEPITSGFHTYGVVWNTKGVTWYFDGYAYAHMSSYAGWPFDHPFFIILNLAIGGGYPGSPTKSTPFPARMVVDWVRVYRHVGS